jgi:polyhydroxybutyrate depolymerase
VGGSRYVAQDARLPEETPLRIPRRRLLHLAAGLPFVSRTARAQADPTRPPRAEIARVTTLTVTIGDQARAALLHIPSTFDRRRKYPLVLGYHGGLRNAKAYVEQSQLFAKGEQAGFIVACPQGTPMFRMGNFRMWNSGPEYAQVLRNVDDVAFTRALIARIAVQYPIDSKRIYITGFSNGAQMAYRLAVELADKVAAIAPMIGARLAGNLRPTRPVPILHIHGTADDYYPIDGGRGLYTFGVVPHVPVESVIAEWSSFNGDAPSHRLVTHDGWDMQVYDGPAPVVLVRVLGMGHQIAGGSDDHLPLQAMRTAPDALAMALVFFGEHPIKH